MGRKNQKVILLGIFCMAANVAVAQAPCDNPVISMQNVRNESVSLRYDQPDTVLIRVSCLTPCKVIATSKTVGIRRLADDKFLFRPYKAGQHEVVIRTECPEGTELPSGLDMSGTTPIGTLKVDARE